MDHHLLRQLTLAGSARPVSPTRPSRALEIAGTAATAVDGHQLPQAPLNPSVPAVLPSPPASPGPLATNRSPGAAQAPERTGAQLIDACIARGFEQGAEAGIEALAQLRLEAADEANRAFSQGFLVLGSLPAYAARSARQHDLLDAGVRYFRTAARLDPARYGRERLRESCSLSSVKQGDLAYILARLGHMRDAVVADAAYALTHPGIGEPDVPYKLLHHGARDVQGAVTFANIQMTLLPWVVTSSLTLLTGLITRQGVEVPEDGRAMILREAAACPCMQDLVARYNIPPPDLNVALPPVSWSYLIGRQAYEAAETDLRHLRDRVGTLGALEAFGLAMLVVRKMMRHRSGQPGACLDSATWSEAVALMAEAAAADNGEGHPRDLWPQVQTQLVESGSYDARATRAIDVQFVETAVVMSTGQSDSRTLAWALLVEAGLETMIFARYDRMEPSTFLRLFITPIGQFLLTQHRYAAAKRFYRTCAARRPMLTERGETRVAVGLWLGRAEAEYALGKRAEAEATLADLAARVEGSEAAGPAALGSATLFRQNGAPDAAFHCLQIARAAEVLPVTTHRVLALVHADRGEFSAALAAINWAVDADPVDGESRLVRAELVLRGTPPDAGPDVCEAACDEACRNWRQAIELSESDGAVRSARIYLAIMQIARPQAGRGPRGVEDVKAGYHALRELVGEVNLPGSFYVEVSRSLMDLGASPSARAVLEDGHRADPAADDVAVELALYHLRREDFVSCLASLAPVAVGACPYADIIRGQALCHTGAIDAAEVALRAAVAHAPPDDAYLAAQAPFVLGILLLEHRTLAEARPYLEAATRAAPDVDAYRVCLQELSAREARATWAAEHQQQREEAWTTNRAAAAAEQSRLDGHAEAEHRRYLAAVADANRDLRVAATHEAAHLRRAIGKQVLRTGGIVAVKGLVTVISTMCGCPIVLF